MHDKKEGLALNKKILEKCKELYDKNFRTNHLLACIVDICFERHSINEPGDDFFNMDQAFTVFIQLSFTFITLKFH